MRRAGMDRWTPVLDYDIRATACNGFIRLRLKDEEAKKPWGDGVSGSDLKEAEIKKESWTTASSKWT